ncbi:hypothetical protein GCM10022288_24870 [Gryllotalpicola kribbensis]|uniref:protein adenylyltransferase n=1 Tax=Gryllotalpicola kribbensis TaxID=993084 RepID=A0ABP8AWT9_9MICO
MPDHYTHPGTEVLINIPGYTDPSLWKAAKAVVVHAHYAELLLNPIPGRFDLPHLQAIHAHLVDGFYTWGGRLRDTDTGPGGTGVVHCRPEHIPAEAQRIFDTLADMDYLRSRETDSFSAGLAWVWGETTALHPFRDVNTRTQFVFFNQLALRAGWAIDWDLIAPHVFAHAHTIAITHNKQGLDALIHPVFIPVAELAAHDQLHDQLQHGRELPFGRLFNCRCPLGRRVRRAPVPR